MSEGVLHWDGGWTWYRVEGELPSTGPAPLVILHGGPGAAHDYLEPIAELASTAGRPCVLYDQIGCGRSQHLRDAPPDFWTVELFVSELAALLTELGISDRYHVLGQSWGGMLALAYAQTQPAGLAGLVVQSSPASVPFWLTELLRLRAELPVEVQAVLERHEAAGTTSDPEYEEASMVFYRRHVCRTDPWPDWLERTFATLAENSEVYETMNGPNEFHVIGPLKDFDITDGLGAVHVPTLLISGRHDEVTPATVERLHHALPDSEWLLLDESSHMAQAEQPAETLGAIRSFLERVEAG